MATYTSNINLKKPAQSDKIRIADFNTNADNIDAALGAGFGVSSAPSVNAEINSLADGLAIIANGNVHAAISSGQFVYVRGHGTLANGLYVANQNISANATLTSSNLDADSSGGLNALNAKFDDLIQQKTIAESASSTSKTINIGNNARAIIDYVTNNVSGCFSIIVLTNSSGVVSILEKAKGEAVSFDTQTNNKIIISVGNTARQGVFFVMGRSSDISGISLG